MARPRRQIRTASPVTREFFNTLDQSGVSVRRICQLAHVSENTVGNWRAGRASMNVFSMETALSVLGLELVIQPKTPDPEEK